MEPLEAAESQLRFLEVNQNNLEDDYSELIDLLKTESEDEENLNAALISLVNQLQQIRDDSSQFALNDLERVQNEALPILQQQLNDIRNQQEYAESNRQAVERSWPSDEITIDVAQSLIDEIGSGVDEQINKQKANDEWLKVMKIFKLM